MYATIIKYSHSGMLLALKASLYTTCSYARCVYECVLYARMYVCVINGNRLSFFYNIFKTQLTTAVFLKLLVFISRSNSLLIWIFSQKLIINKAIKSPSLTHITFWYKNDSHVVSISRSLSTCVDKYTIIFLHAAK